MQLQTKNLIIRDLEDKDETSILRILNNLNVSKNLQIIPHPYTEKDAKSWIFYSKEKSKDKKRKSYSFVIELKENKELIGSVGIEKIDFFAEKAIIGYWLDEKYWNKGIMTEALSKIIDFAFHELKLNRLDLSTFVENLASNKLAKKMGFTLEGIRKQYHKDKATGTLHDVNIYGLLKKDYL